MSSTGKPIVTQLVIDASGAKAGEAEWSATMDKMKAKYQESGGAATSFEAAQRKWVNSLAAADPVIRASINMQQALNRQMMINAEAVKLGITSQDAAAQQLERVRTKYQAYVTSAQIATQETSRFGAAMESVTGFAGKMVGTLGLLGVVSIMERLSHDAIDTASKLHDVSERTQFSTDAIQRFGYGSKQAGVDATEFTGALDQLLKRLGQAQQGTGPLKGLYNSLHLAGDTPEQAFGAIADAVQHASTVTQKYTIVNDAFGKSAAGMVAYLNHGALGLKEMGDQAARLGQLMDRDTINKLDDLSKSLDRLKVSSINLSAGPLAGTATVITNIIDALRQGGWQAGAEALGGFLANLAGETGGYNSDYLNNRVVYATKNLAELRAEMARINRAIAAEGGLQRPGTTGRARELQGEINDWQNQLNNAVSAMSLRDYAGKHIGRSHHGTTLDTVPFGAFTPLDTTATGGAAPDSVRPNGFGFSAGDMGAVNAALKAQLDLGAKKIAQMNAEAATYGMTTSQAVAYSYQLEALSAIQQKNGKVTDADRKAIAAQADALGHAAQQADRFKIAQAASALDQSFGNQIFGVGADLAQRAAITGVDTNATAGRHTAYDAYDVSGKTVKDRQDLQDRLTAIDTAASMQRQQIAQSEAEARLSIASGVFGNLATLSESSNQTLAAIGKASAIAQATVDGFLAVQKAYLEVPYPFNIAAAAAVGVASAANVAKIAGVGFEAGGYTGDAPRTAITGFVHGKEFVTHADATARYRPELEAMNAGTYYGARNWAPTPANSNGTTVKVIIQNNAAGVRVSRRQMSDDEILIAIDNISTHNDHKNGPRIIESQVSDPSTGAGRALERLTSVKYRR